MGVGVFGSELCCEGKSVMQLYLSKADQISYTAKQLDHFSPCVGDGRTVAEISRCVDLAYDRLEHCFSKVSVKYYKKDGEVFFSPLITDQYATFLYLLSNSIATESQNFELADRIYGLNKALHGLDVFHQVQLPRIFLLVHTVGTVLGRACYSDYLVVYQGVTVGGNIDLEYPTIGKGVGLFANSMVIGNSVVGEGSMLAAGALLMDSNIPDGHVCFGMHPENKHKPLKKSVAERYFIK